MKVVALGTLALLAAACGVVGPPIPPERVGIGPTIERQKQLEASEAKMREEAEKQLVIPPPGQDEDLPPLRPVGAR